MDPYESRYADTLENSIKIYDEDLARMIVFAGLSKNNKHLKKMFSLASHIQNIRAVEQETFTKADIATIEATNVELIKLYLDQDDFVC